jgi:ABC-2 type transport system permease protein
MPLHDSSYQHWDGQHLGIWWRRAVIAGNGLKGCLQNKWMRHVITLCWAQSLAIAAVLFMIGQLLVSDSVVVRWLSHLNPQLQSVGDGLISWLVGHPEISVRTEENVLFFFCCRPLMLFSLVAIILALPHLITRDLSSRAIIVYSSKAVGRIDYLIGKFGTIFGLLFLTWMGPLCVAWLLGNLLAPNWHFFWHSRVALGNTLLFVFTSMVILSALGLGVSAMAQREKSVVGIWLLLWLAASSVANIPHQSHSWLKHCSFAYNLDQIQYAVFRLPNDLKLAQDNIPLLGGLLREIQRNTFSAWEHPELSGALIASAIMIGLAALIIAWRVKPE